MAAIKPNIKLQPIRRCQSNRCLANGMCSYKLYDADVSPALISKVTDAVIEQVVEWKNRPLDAVYLDCIILKVQQDSRVINKSVFLALGINIEGQKKLPGKWLAENEGMKFWFNVLTELKTRGLTISSPPV